MPLIVSTILKIVGTEISKQAAAMQVHVAAQDAPGGASYIVAPNGKLSIEGAKDSEKKEVAALAKFVSKLRDFQPELVDGKLAAVLYKMHPNPAVYLNYLVGGKGRLSLEDLEDATDLVLKAHVTRTAISKQVRGDDIGFHVKWVTSRHTAPHCTTL